MKNKKYIVTGGAGFIGSHIVEKLLHIGCEVVVLDDLSTGFMEYLPEHENLTFLNVDISDWDVLSRCFNYLRGADGLFHLAAKARIQPSIFNPVRHHAVNVNGIFNVLEVMRMMDIKRIVYSASSSSYGLKEEMPCVETDPPDCLNPYALMKYVGEQYCKTWTKLYGIHSVCLKYFNVYGKRSPLTPPYAPIIGLFFYQAVKEQPITIIGDGEQRRDFTHVDDVVNANILAMKHAENDGVSGECFNVGAAKNYSVNEVAEMVRKEMLLYGTQVTMKTLPPRPAEARETLADITKIQETLGWKPEKSLEDCVNELCLYYRHIVK